MNKDQVKPALDTDLDELDTLERLVFQEVFGLLGIQDRKRLQPLVKRLLYAPIHRFAALVARINRDTSEKGFAAGMASLAANFVRQVEVRGAEHIPTAGPLLIASNHPAAYDMPIIASNARREDLKVVTSEIPAIRWLPALAPHFIMIGNTLQERMAAVRHSLRHLRDGGALLIFPRGNVDPDPAVSPGASQALGLWSSSVELFLRQAPDTCLVLTVVSGVLSPIAFRNPLARLRKTPSDRQKAAEVFQVVYQMLFPGRLMLDPQVSFGRPIGTSELNAGREEQPLLPAIIANARLALEEHAAAFEGLIAGI